MLQSHASHPWLVYFRSVGTATGWPAALGAFADMALICETLLDDPQLRGPAEMGREQAQLLACDLVKMLNLPAEPDATEHEVVERLCGRLVAAGYRLREDRDLAAFMTRREALNAPIRALADHLGSAHAPLLPPG